jgi:amino acid adenylation domain-containing protein
VAGIWAEVLSIERVGRHDNFFELGGHSLLAMRLISRIREALHLEVRLSSIFQHPELAKWTQHLSHAAQTRLPPISRASRDADLPLSFAQYRMWFLSQMEGGSEAYHISFGIALKGELDRVALYRAFGRIIERHEILRTTFSLADGKLVQRINDARQSGFMWIEHDLQHHKDAPGELQRLMEVEAGSGFDLQRGPLVRGRLIRQSEDQYVLLITMHHIVSDGWSMGVFAEELNVLYSAFLQAKADPLPELSVQYADYALWQRQWIAGEVLRQQAEYWNQVLADAPALLELPSDHARPPQQDYAGGFVSMIVDAELASALKELGRRQGTTMFMTLLAGWAALLGRLAAQEEVVIGTPVANRERPEIENLIGLFINTLALRIRVSGGFSLNELLKRVKAQVLTAQQHSDIPFEQVVENARPERSLAHGPLFQTMFAWQNTAQKQLQLPSVEVIPISAAEHRVAKFDLTLVLQEAGPVLVGGMEYARSLFEAATIERYIGYFRRLLQGMVSLPGGQPLGELSLLSEAERQQVVFQWNDTAVDFPADQCVHELVEAQALRTPEAKAVIAAAELTYGELNRRANQLAHYLRQLGVKPDTRVAVAIERSAEMVVGLLAVLKAGGAYMPLDPSFPAERLRYILADSAPVAMLTCAHLSDRLVFSGSLPVIDLMAQSPLWSVQPDTNPILANVSVTPRNLAYVIYTSGSTGMPKGVAVEHRNLTNLIHWHCNAFDLKCGRRCSSVAGLGFDAAAWEIWPALCAGATLLLPATGDSSDAERLRRWWEAQELHVSFLPTPLAEFAFTHAWTNTHLQTLLVGGDRLRYLPHEQMTFALINNYGPTEATVVATSGRVESAGKVLAIGRPIANTRIYILDKHQQPVPIGVTGELYIAGAGVARGYLNRPELTAGSFLSDPFSATQARMYRTGDLARWRTDGTIAFLGRSDLQVKIRGFRIELGEIEAGLIRHPEIKEVAVIAQEDSAGEKRLVAFYTCANTNAQHETLEAGTLRGYLAAQLPGHMIPAAFVQLERLPLTANGKLDRYALAAFATDVRAARAYEPPAGEIETTLAKIWADVLTADRIGRHDNFFELGGHSLLAVTLMERMRRHDLHVDVKTLFAAPTLAHLASEVRFESSIVEVPPNLVPAECASITPEMLPLVRLTSEAIAAIVSQVPGGARNVQDIYPLAPLQEGILFHHLLGGEGDPYLLTVLLAFDGRARLDQYLEGLQAVIERHDILRTAFLWEGLPKPVQVVWRKAVLCMEVVAMDPGSGDVSRQMRERFNSRRYRIDVRQAPLLRAYVAYDGPNQRWLMLLLFHHLVGDHSTLEMVAKEIQAFHQDNAEELPQAQPFRNLVAQAHLGISPEEHEAFFRQMLGDVEEPTAPFGLLQLQNDDGIQEARAGLDDILARRVRERARTLGVSAASVFHLGWALVLARLSGRNDVVFGTVLCGRMQATRAAGQAVGLFINTLPLRFRINEEGVQAAIWRMHVLLADLMRHEHASLALAQRCSAVQAPAPLFSALLNYRHRAVASESSAGIRAFQGVEQLYVEERNNYPFTLAVDDLGETFTLTARTAASIEALRICGFMHAALEALVAALATMPAAALSALEVLPEKELYHVLYEWNHTAVKYSGDYCAHELFEAQARRTPHAVALVSNQGEVTYEELNRRANQLAHYLRTLGVRPDEKVAICVKRGLQMMTGLLAILKAGGSYVPLDPAYPPERLGYVLKDSAPVALLTQSHLEGLFLAMRHSLLVIDLDAATPPWSEQPDTNLLRADVGLDPRHLAYVIYTSGSTGLPKGVMIEHRNLSNYLRWSGQAYYQQDGAGSPAIHSIGFDGLVTTLYGPLIAGQTLFLPAPGEEMNEVASRPSSGAAPYTLMKVTPSHLQLLNRLIPPDATTTPAQTLMIGGEALVPADIFFWKKRFPSVRLVNHFGPTEITVGCCTFEISDVAVDERSIPIGKPLANTLIYILDAFQRPAPVGVPGELYVAGAGTARGYVGRPELTAERFVPNPFAQQAGARMYRTGDLGRWLADGNIEFLGRSDAQVKIRGFRIELGEIEARLLECAGVRQAVVMVREDTPEEKRLVAYYVMDEESAGAGAQPEMGAMRRHLSGCLPEYMVPAAYVRLQRLPLTPHGKLDRNALPQPQSSAYAVREYEEPQGEMESRVAGIWAEVLSIERVGRHDNFFELGGHSLLAMRLVERLRQQKFHLDVHTIFTNPILSGMAARVMENVDGRQDLERNNKFQHSSLVELKVGNPSVQPFFLIHPVGGYVSCYSELALGLEYEGPVFGLQIAGTVSPTIEQMAGKYLEAVRSVQPQGPYLLGGWSMGGVVAYEMARQLNCVGECISVLVMLDSSFPNRMKTDVNWSLDEKLALGIIASELGIRHQGLAPVENNTWNKITLEELLIVVLQAGKAQDRLPASFGIQELRQRHEIILKNASGVRSYQALPYDGEIHLVRAMENTNADPFLGWSALPAKVSVINQPGDHFSMMRRPHVAALSKKVDSLLRAHFTQSLTLRKTMRIEVTDVIPKPR